MWLRVLHPKDLPVEHRSLKFSVETHGAGSKPEVCPSLPDLPCLCDPNWSVLPWVVLAGTEMASR